MIYAWSAAIGVNHIIHRSQRLSWIMICFQRGRSLSWKHVVTLHLWVMYRYYLPSKNNCQCGQLLTKSKKGRSLISLICLPCWHVTYMPCLYVTNGLSRGVHVVWFECINWHMTCHVLSGCVRVGYVPSSLTLSCENKSRKCEVIRLELWK